MTWTPTPPCPCGTPISADGPSPDYCSEACQHRYMGLGHDPIPVPARPEWWLGCTCATSDQPYVHHCGTGGQEETRPLNREPGGVSTQPTAAFGFTEFRQFTPAPSLLRRIFNTTRRNT